MSLRVAVLSLHSCPNGRPGTRDTGGMNVYVRKTARELGRLGITLDIFTKLDTSCVKKEVQIADGVRLIHLPPDGIKSKLGMYTHLPDMAATIDRLKEEQQLTYDVIHSHYWLSGVVGNILAQRWDVPHVTTLHTSARAKNDYMGANSEPELRSEAEALILGSADRIAVTSSRDRSELARFYQVPESKFSVTFAGVDHGLFRPLPKTESRRKLGLSGKPLVLFVGRMEALKGVELLLEAVGRIRSNGGKEMSLAVVGGDPGDDREMQRLREMASGYGIGGDDVFRGTVDQAELPGYYSAADVCVLPSRYETFGLVILESLACGTPVISTRVGCAEEVIKPGSNGWLLTQPSAPELSSLLLRLTHSSEISDCSKHAGESVQDYSWASTAARLAGEYRSLAA